MYIRDEGPFFPINSLVHILTLGGTILSSSTAEFNVGSLVLRKKLICP